MIIYHHLGLGDHIVCNGLVRSLSESLKIQLICKANNLSNINFMYRDNSNISLIPVSSDNQANQICINNNDLLRIGFAVGGNSYPNKLWDETFYLNVNLPFDYSWSKFYYTRDIHKENKTYEDLVKQEDYIFVHNIDSYGVDRINWQIIPNNYQVIISDKSIGFFYYGKIIEKAKEIHCIDSSFKHLIDRIPTTGKLFFHKLNNPKLFDSHNTKKEWIIV